MGEDVQAGAVLRDARTRAGLTQARLAHRAGTSQPAVCRYESGASSPSMATLERLLAACGKDLQISTVDRPAATGQGPMARRVLERRGELRRAILDAGARNPRVFGSTARGTDTEQSDLDLLVDLPRPSYLLLARVQSAAEQALGASVDVSTPELLRAGLRDRILAESVPL